MPRIAVLGGAAVLAVTLVAASGWYFLVRGDEPPPVSLADAITSSSGVTTAMPSPTAATPAPNVTTAASATPGASTSTPTTDGDLAGTWTVDPGASFVGYRIDEVLSGIGSATAVGRTSAVEGALTFDGAVIADVEVTADLTQLESDDSRRDGQLRRQALETNQYPTSTFVLVEPIAIDGDPWVSRSSRSQLATSRCTASRIGWS
ncbi:MAG: YceI family protein [Chloroflexi bacterium]|nr:YceI family protein [Chloroflexota bacterium]